VITIAILYNGQEHLERSLLDTGSQVNLISQKLVKRLGLAEETRPFASITAVNGTSMFIYGTHQLQIRATDSTGRATTRQETFLAADISGEEIILGYGWIKTHKPVCDWEVGSWRYPLDETSLEIVDAAVFYKDMAKEGARVHAVYY